MNTEDVLIAAKRLLVERGWTQGAPARGPDGRYLAAYDPRAVCFCASGAVSAVTYRTWVRIAAEGVLRRVLASHGYVSIVSYNDAPDRRKEDVLSLFDEAIASLTPNSEKDT